MPPTNANPGAGGARVHASSNNNAAPTTRNQSPAQANAHTAARAILDAALKRGIHVGAAPDGSELVLVAPLKVPRDVRRWFEIWLDNFRDEVIAIIQREAEERERNKLKAEQTREAEFVQH